MGYSVLPFEKEGVNMGFWAGFKKGVFMPLEIVGFLKEDDYFGEMVGFVLIMSIITWGIAFSIVFISEVL